MAEPEYTMEPNSEREETKPAPEFQDPALGIDIGTSHCRVAVWNGFSVELLKNARNETASQSYVTFDGETPTGGIRNPLNDELEIFSGSAIFNIKRLIGRADTDPVVHASKSLPYMVQTLDIGARPFVAALVNNVWRATTPEEALTILLVELRSMAETQLRKTVRNVVLTVPVSFSRFQLTRIERACAMAGLHVLRLMPEPTAVALLFAHKLQQTELENMGSGSEKVALIFNMGAGYCDVCVTAIAGGVSQIKGVAGSPVGGEDLLRNMMHFLAPSGVEDIKLVGLFWIAFQHVIHQLSFQDFVTIQADYGSGTTIRTLLIHRTRFEEVNRKVFEECEMLVLQCICNAKIHVKEITDVILVGGCSHIPKVRNLVLNLCEKDVPYPGMNPLESAVYGAALEGAVASGLANSAGNLKLLSVHPITHPLGIKADGHHFVCIMQSNTAIPSRKELWFTTANDNQAEALIMVYEGEGNTVEENHLLGYFKIAGIPPAQKGCSEVSVVMDIDASNTLRVSAAASCPRSRQPLSPYLEVRMPNVDDGHGWCAEALINKYGSTLDLAIPKNT
ncbi:hypothetical protein Sjap_006570 [Stephania japonica]|uniref:Heat shock 70 kDa protein 8 n=1 Tax=Stephania japonica TaxID=461633 RepID=A0AAP0K642_9MAGN